MNNLSRGMQEWQQDGPGGEILFELFKKYGLDNFVGTITMNHQRIKTSVTLTESTQKTNPIQRGLKERKDRATMDYDNQYNDRPQHDRYSDGAYDDRPPRPQADPPLITEKIVTDRKVFFLDLKENNRGRVLKITEDVRGRRDTIMVPVETLIDFYEAIGRIIDYERTV